MKNHINSVHLLFQAFACEFCRRGFANPNSLRRHKEKHHFPSADPAIADDIGLPSDPENMGVLSENSGMEVSDSFSTDSPWGNFSESSSFEHSPTPIHEYEVIYKKPRFSPTWHNSLPPRDSPFVGRESELAQIDELLGKSQRVVVTGLPGMGKSCLVKEFAHRRGFEMYPVIWWVSAETEPQMKESLDRFLVTHWEDAPHSTFHECKTSVQACLSQHPGWLFIFDNLQSLSQLDFLSICPPGSGIIVTMQDTPSAEGVIRLQGFERADSTALLLKIIPKAGLQSGEGEAADALSQHLHDFPQAIKQAGMLVKSGRVHTSLQSLLRGIMKPPKELQESIDSIISSEAWKALSADADTQKLLLYMSFLCPDDIPIWLLSAVESDFDPDGLVSLEGVASMNVDEDSVLGEQLGQRLAVLEGHSFVSRDLERGSCSMHRRLQGAIRTQGVMSGDRALKDLLHTIEGEESGIRLGRQWSRLPALLSNVNCLAAHIARSADTSLRSSLPRVLKRCADLAVVVMGYKEEGARFLDLIDGRLLWEDNWEYSERVLDLGKYTLFARMMESSDKYLGQALAKSDPRHKPQHLFEIGEAYAVSEMADKAEPHFDAFLSAKQESLISVWTLLDIAQGLFFAQHPSACKYLHGALWEARQTLEKHSVEFARVLLRAGKLLLLAQKPRGVQVIRHALVLLGQCGYGGALSREENATIAAHLLNKKKTKEGLSLLQIPDNVQGAERAALLLHFAQVAKRVPEEARKYLLQVTELPLAEPSQVANARLALAYLALGDPRTRQDALLHFEQVAQILAPGDLRKIGRAMLAYGPQFVRGELKPSECQQRGLDYLNQAAAKASGPDKALAMCDLALGFAQCGDHESLKTSLDQAIDALRPYPQLGSSLQIKEGAGLALLEVVVKTASKNASTIFRPHLLVAIFLFEQVRKSSPRADHAVVLARASLILGNSEKAIGYFDDARVLAKDSPRKAREELYHTMGCLSVDFVPLVAAFYFDQVIALKGEALCTLDHEDIAVYQHGCAKWLAKTPALSRRFLDDAAKTRRSLLKGGISKQLGDLYVDVGQELLHFKNTEDARGCFGDAVEQYKAVTGEETLLADEALKACEALLAKIVL